MYNDKKAAALSEMETMKQELIKAGDQVQRAQDELDHILSLPPIHEPSHFEDVQWAQRLDQPEPFQKKGRNTFPFLSALINDSHD